MGPGAQALGPSFLSIHFGCSPNSETHMFKLTICDHNSSCTFVLAETDFRREVSWLQTHNEFSFGWTKIA